MNRIIDLYNAQYVVNNKGRHIIYQTIDGCASVNAFTTGDWQKMAKNTGLGWPGIIFFWRSP